MSRLELRSDLDRDVLDAVLRLIDVTTSSQGHPPIGEQKLSQLEVGATDWSAALAWDGDDLVGYAHMRWNPPGQLPRSAVEVIVHPDRDDSDLAEQLVTEARGALAAAGGGVMFVWLHRVRDAGATFAARMGLAVQRELAFMVRPLASPPEVADLPADISLRPYREGIDDAAFLAVNNAAFAGHPENGGWDAAEFARRRAHAWFDPDGLIMAWRREPDRGAAAERCLGFHWTKRHGEGSQDVPGEGPVGEVYVLGIDPSAQGVGLGRGLLRAGLAHLHERDCREAILYVDLANAAAVRLYQSEGFCTRHSEVCYATEVPWAPSGSSL